MRPDLDKDPTPSFATHPFADHSLLSISAHSVGIMPSSQIASPLPIPPPRRNIRLGYSSQDLFASINATLASNIVRPRTPVHNIQEDEYTVPAPPPPSPVSFLPEHWPTSIRR